MKEESYNQRRGRKLHEARVLRKQMTDAEDVLWKALRGRKCGDMKFRRQQPIAWFIVDFLCMEFSLVVEVDGPVHDLQKQYDQNRDTEIIKLGYKILRCSNDQVLNHLDEVLNQILACKNRAPLSR